MATSEPVYKVDLEPVQSTNIGAFGYDSRTHVLAVQFAKTGIIFHYAGVDPNLALDFYRAESKGKFYTQQIRGRFQAARMTGPCPNCGSEGYAGEVCGDCGTAEPVVPARKEGQ